MINKSSADFGFNTLLSELLCPECLGGYIPYESPICIKCGMMFQSREGSDHICGNCIESQKKYRIARAAGIYSNTLMKAIHVFKYKGKIQLAKPFGNLLFAAFLHFWETKDIDLIIPVPLHISRFRERGFNQAYLMIKNWLKMSKELKKNRITFRIDKNNLIRTRKTEPQTGLGRRKRLVNLKDAFNIKDPVRIREKRIILVDDVYTTGSTVSECCRTLIKHGAGSVDVLTLARAI